MKLDLRKRILLPSTILVAVLTAAVTLAAFLMSRAMLTTALDNQLEQTCAGLIGQVESWMDGQKKLLLTMSADANVVKSARGGPDAAAGHEALCGYLQHTTQVYNDSEGINVVDATGAIVAAAKKEVLANKVNVTDRPYIKAALAGQVAVSDVFASRLTGNPIVSVASPITEGGAVRGALFKVLSLDAFTSKFISNLKVLQTGYAYLYDRDGLTLAHPDRTNILKLKISENEWGRQMLQKGSGQLRYTFGGVDKKVIFKTSPSLQWGVAITVPERELNAPIRRLTLVVSSFGLVGLAAALAVLLLTARSITVPLRRAIDRLTLGASQTTEAAQQVASASQALAEGASEQAASLEESSASLEEMASMTKQNVDSTDKAKDLAAQARQAADAGAGDVQTMNAAMGAIKESSAEIAKIIKTIDEIAFQTNILALNAAVEAARAGEAGMGFAVVAEEVRNLAQRSAQAARETAAKIEGAIGKTEQGVAVSAKVAQRLEEIVSKVRQVDDLVAEIAAASREQSQGIDQVNTAVGQMDKVTQSNSASSEESAAAAQELNVQAGTLRETVGQLIALVNGTDSGLAQEIAASSASRSGTRLSTSATATGSSKPGWTKAPKRPQAVAPSKPTGAKPSATDPDQHSLSF